jgi:lipopolysaccharide biosynthesis glycosyltransferase
VTYNKIYIGWDSKQDIAYNVLRHSLLRRSSGLEIIPLKQYELRDKNIYKRPIDPLSSTEFTFTRFLVPFLQQFRNWALFMDCDMLSLIDINQVFNMADEKYAVMCAKHDYRPKDKIKMDKKVQNLYPRKNWSSLMLFNCSHASNKKITKEVVNNVNVSGQYLHRLSWLKDEEIGTINHEYNWLVNWYEEPKDGKPKILHYTEGGPWLDKYKNGKYSEIWNKELKLLDEVGN